MRIITMKTIMDQLASDAKGNRGCGLILLAVLAVFLVGGTIALNSAFGILMLAAFLILAVAMFKIGRRQRRSLKDRTFYLVEDICIEKYIHEDSEGADSYQLIFASGQGRFLCHGDVTMTFETTGNHENDIFQATEQGDRFYMVYLEGEKEPVYVFPQKLCQLDMTGFTLRNGRIYPQKLQ